VQIRHLDIRESLADWSAAYIPRDELGVLNPREPTFEPGPDNTGPAFLILDQLDTESFSVRLERREWRIRFIGSRIYVSQLTRDIAWRPTKEDGFPDSCFMHAHIAFRHLTCASFNRLKIMYKLPQLYLFAYRRI
jgi:hypothetical protein